MAAEANDEIGTLCPHGFPSMKSCIDCMYEEGVGGDEADAVSVEATFAARFDGDCPACHLGIHVGQRIAKLSNNRYVHEGCV